MSLATIIQKIDADAEASRQKLLAQARTEAERIVEQGRAEAEQEAADILQRTDDDLQSFRNKQLATAQLQGRNRTLENRQQLLHEVFTQALERIIACDEAQYHTIFKTLLLALHEEQPGEILPAKADQKLFSKAFVDEINSELEAQQRQLRFTVSANTASIPRGCVVDFQDFEINYSFEHLLAGLWEQIKTDVSAQLFDDGNH